MEVIGKSGPSERRPPACHVRWKQMTASGHTSKSAKEQIGDSKQQPATQLMVPFIVAMRR